ncbi:hypothetical protein [Bradyrhizobium canariense]|uniref:hypothetical protein n=1 Tax=Bradyrhizobium canariense TaxID=255045 RepID=UPI000A18C9A8|nr:hypothetical protein [Bradyrhizobium canariense]OSI20087.1 hypothetical protein BST65_35255 [Bradyrhizobium canariense]OSI26160.1 hypothetical protein BST66_38020 [Bradyrhizobium canariense]OSI37673.1 hypothetical protein BSZ20_38050 [Bradyrhizobium canariense]OSI42421.1 hypothetical protein BST67_37400 [Bradyrhizobium canariense]OSI57274.1 hypothetical protein BSZ15_14405 [Bradyrhizobium canariense]
MADTKTSAETTSGAIADADLFGGVQGGVNVKFLFSAVKTWIQSWVYTGITDASNAAAGRVGQFITQTTLRAANTALTTSTPKTCASILLQPGDYEVWGVGGFSNGGGSMTGLYASISQADNVLTGFDSAALTQTLGPAVTGECIIPTPRVRVNVSVATTVYLVQQASYTGTTTIYGTINARRAN